jgi:hypothetical protein
LSAPEGQDGTEPVAKKTAAKSGLTEVWLEARRRHRKDLEVLWSDDARQEGASVVFHLGGRLDLLEDFLGAPLGLASPEELGGTRSRE